MTSNIVNTIPYLPTSRKFPQEIEPLTVQIDRAYVDTANAVNARTIGIYSVNKAAQIGDNWFLTPTPQEAYRQVYAITGSGTVAHNLDFNQLAGFVKIYGSATDGTLWFPLPYVDVTNVTNQILITLDSTNINITAGGGSPPTISSGFVVLEWISPT